MLEEKLPYWLVNIPKDQWPAECPDFLLEISSRDRKMISMPNEDFHRLTWPEVQKIIGREKIPHEQQESSRLTVRKIRIESIYSSEPH